MLRSERARIWSKAGEDACRRINAFTHAQLDRVVCLTCGYCEDWLTGAALAKARKHGAYIAIPTSPWGGAGGRRGDGVGRGPPGVSAP